jgi:hypothetical protein
MAGPGLGGGVVRGGGEVCRHLGHRWARHVTDVRQQLIKEKILNKDQHTGFPRVRHPVNDMVMQRNQQQQHGSMCMYAIHKVRLASHDSIVRHGMAWHGMAWHGMAWHTPASSELRRKPASSGTRGDRALSSLSAIARAVSPASSHGTRIASHHTPPATSTAGKVNKSYTVTKMGPNAPAADWLGRDGIAARGNVSVLSGSDSVSVLSDSTLPEPCASIACRPA